jgi:hypothetical protein
MTITTHAALAALAALAAAPAAAQDGDGGAAPDFVNRCESAPFTDFDFWVGDWVAFDADSGVVQGIDRIETTLHGCALVQQWTPLTDRYRAAGAPYRFDGMSVNSVLPDGSWQQVWVGAYGGTIVTTGGLDEAGTMVLETPPFEAADGKTYDRRWYWDPQDDGTIRSWGEFRSMNEDGSWSEPQTPWNLRYVRRADAPNLAEAPDAED